MRYYETSAKTGINVKESINTLLDSVYEQKFVPLIKKVEIKELDDLK